MAERKAAAGNPAFADISPRSSKAQSVVSQRSVEERRLAERAAQREADFKKRKAASGENAKSAFDLKAEQEALLKQKAADREAEFKKKKEREQERAAVREQVKKEKEAQFAGPKSKPNTSPISIPTTQGSRRGGSTSPVSSSYGSSPSGSPKSPTPPSSTSPTSMSKHAQERAEYEAKKLARERAQAPSLVIQDPNFELYIAGRKEAAFMHILDFDVFTHVVSRVRPHRSQSALC